jgi:hypothetical protein
MVFMCPSASLRRNCAKWAKPVRIGYCTK